MSTENKPRVIVRESSITETQKDSAWSVILFNCYCHSYEEVVEQVMGSTVCGYAAGCNHADAAEEFGSTKVFEGSFSDCTRVAGVLGSTGIDVRITQ